jgi:hypothetical protein
MRTYPDIYHCMTVPGRDLRVGDRMMDVAYPDRAAEALSEVTDFGGVVMRVRFEDHRDECHYMGKDARLVVARRACRHDSLTRDCPYCRECDERP